MKGPVTLHGLNVSVRELLERDEGFVVKGFVESFRKSHWCGVLPMRVFSREHRIHMTRVLHDRATTYIAVNADEPDPDYEILGCLVCEPKKHVAHWCYVKDMLRGYGVARLLLQVAGFDMERGFVVSTRTPDLDDYRAACEKAGKAYNIVHDPRYLRDWNWNGKPHGKTQASAIQGRGERIRQVERDHR